jgi:hypothetical protein
MPIMAEYIKTTVKKILKQIQSLGVRICTAHALQMFSLWLICDVQPLVRDLLHKRCATRSISRRYDRLLRVVLSIVYSYATRGPLVPRGDYLTHGAHGPRGLVANANFLSSDVLTAVRRKTTRQQSTKLSFDHGRPCSGCVESPRR